MLAVRFEASFIFTEEVAGRSPTMALSPVKGASLVPDLKGLLRYPRACGLGRRVGAEQGFGPLLAEKEIHLGHRAIGHHEGTEARPFR